MVALRYAVLRKPLGLVFTPEQLEQEANHTHIAAWLPETAYMAGCLILQPTTPTDLKMRQVAVHPNHQKQSIGKKMCDFAEVWAINHNFKRLYCHARATAVPFYQKMGWRIIGQPFEDVFCKFGTIFASFYYSNRTYLEVLRYFCNKIRLNNANSIIR
ncbi:MAG TPA: GNAT family N-acetyltransferase [Chitinophagales bacterium]|nr:GNAT family N-acetyltransferase [Chitinophagales bacterium]